MARDGTNRGGARVGAGRKPKALTEKITEGKTNKKITPNDDCELQGFDMPQIKEYMLANQKNGIELCAEEVYTDTWKYLQKRNCETIVNSQLVYQYAMSVARWVQCETAISEYGFLAKHPTTGGAIASPYVAMSREYLKQVNQAWFLIYQIVKDNSTTEFQGASPQDDLMERLLNSKK